MYDSTPDSLYPFKLLRLTDWYQKYNATDFRDLYRFLWLGDRKGMLCLHAGLRMPVPQYNKNGWILMVDDVFVETFLSHHPKYLGSGLLAKSGNFLHVPVDQEFAVELEVWSSWMDCAIQKTRPVEWLQVSFNLFLLMCLRVYKEEFAVSVVFRKSQPMLRLTELMREHYKSGAGTAYYAERLALTPKVANKLCRMATGDNLSTQLYKLKLAEAKRLLLMTDRQIKEIAFELGFASLQSFSMFFKKMTGYSPARFKALGARSFPHGSAFPT